MGILDLMTKVEAKRICGIDASTNSLAFAVFDDGKPVVCGEVKFSGSTVFERLRDAQRKTRVLIELGFLKADYVVIESSVMVKNINVAIDLAYVYGAIIAELMAFNPEVHKIAPITWQSGIGNKLLNASEKKAIQTEFPNRSKTWYSNKGREIRKQRTLDIARQYFEIENGSDNVGDAVGIALYATDALTR